MVALYIASAEDAAGKTMLCAGIGRHLANEGRKVGFLKAVIADSANPPAAGADSDAEFMKRILDLSEPVDQLCTVITEKNDMVNSIRGAYDKISKDKDIVIVEGVCGLGSEGILDRASFVIAEALCARVIVVERYSNQSPLEAFTDIYGEFGDLLVGVVLNQVPKNRLSKVREEASAVFGKAGIDILGTLSEDRTLLAPTVGEISEKIQGKMLNHPEKSAELVENIMLGAKAVDPGPEYFRLKTNKAVIVRGERPDMQLAALETPVKCLILTGGTSPIPSVSYGAENSSVPIISTEADINSIVDNIEAALSNAKFNQDEKLARLAEILEADFDYKTLYKGIESK